MVTRALADSVRVFATAIPIALIISPSVHNQKYVMPVAILILGALTIIYTYRGGMKAVVWTELLQASVYLLGAIVGDRPARSRRERRMVVDPGAGRRRPGSCVSSTRMSGLDRAHTMWAGLIGGAFLAMASHGTDQLIVQRLLSARNLRDGQKAIIGSGLVVFVQFALFLFIGLGLWAFYQGRIFPATDQIFPTFIIDRMPPGLVGLIIAAVVAATMSTHSGAINSLAAATTHDIYLPITKRSADAPETLRMGKIFALIWGTVLTLGALAFPRETNTPGGRRGARHRVVHVRRAARRVLPRCVLVARESARRDPRHERRNRGHELHRVREAAQCRGYRRSPTRSRRSRRSPGPGMC